MSDSSESHASHDLNTPDCAADGDIVLEAVSYTKGDHSMASRQAMKLNALAFILDRNCFLVFHTSSKFVGDRDPGLMSFLFPHLDPWGIGGFYHVTRSRKQYISMEVQVQNLLCQDDSPFKGNANFAFVCFNMC